MSTKPLEDCSGCTDPRSEGTHQEDTKQHPRPEPQQQSWEKDFDDRFPILMLAAKNIDGLGYNVIERRPLVKDFIRAEKEASTLQERTRIVKLVEGMVFPCAHKHETCTTTAPCIHKNGKEEAREEILKSISTNENGV